jgi:hypothetical protein
MAARQVPVTPLGRRDTTDSPHRPPTTGNRQQFTLCGRTLDRPSGCGGHASRCLDYRALTSCRGAGAPRLSKASDIMIRSAIAVAVALLSTAASASLVNSPPVTVTLEIDRFAKGSATVDVTTDTWGNIGAGQLQGLLDGQTFLTYCVDLSQSFSWKTRYTYTLQDNGFTDRQADLLGKLYTAHGSAGAAASTNDSVAFQLAVWEILYDTDPTSVTAGTFHLITGASTAQRTLTNSWLSDINQANATRSFNARRLYSDVAQDFVIFSAVPVTSVSLSASVPEPSSYALAGLALAGLALVRRRARS